jgi:Xaa-Pro aminopeptidase
MKSDLDQLMDARGFDALVVMGPMPENPLLRYMANGARITDGTLIKRRGADPVLVCGSMEREEAAKSGLQVALYSDFYPQPDPKAPPAPPTNLFEKYTQMLKAILEHAGADRGTISFYGRGDPGKSHLELTRLAELMPDVRITGEVETSLFDEACSTKDAAEIAAIKEVAVRTDRVVGLVIDFIKGHRVADEILIKEDGTPLTIGDVKRRMRVWLAEENLDGGGETIFAIGRDAGIPHSRGQDNDALRLGRTIIFDIFPREQGGGYYHDMTRTFCLGYAPPEVQAAYDQVQHIFHQVMEAVNVGTNYRDLQNLTCDFFEKLGHSTVRSNPRGQAGYVHGLGHGLGLEIHERPRMYSDSIDVVKPGHVITIEPGLYYPEQGFGVRLEDTVYIDEQGEAHSLTPYPKDLIIPMG